MAYNKETGMYEGYIYKITNNVNNHFYIGQTRQTIEKRFADHVKDSKMDRYSKYGLYKAMKKYGVDNFSIEQLEKYSCYTDKELLNILNDREHVIIVESKKQYGKSVYNYSDGGDYDGCSVLRVPVIQYDLCGNELERYNTISEAKMKTGCSGIVDVINKKPMSITSGGYVWRRTDNPLTQSEINELLKRFDNSEIVQFGIGMKILNTFKNLNAASDYIINILKSHNETFSAQTIMANIKSCCNGRQKTAFGFIWKYKTDDINDSMFSYDNCVFAIEQRENGTGRLLDTFLSVGQAKRYTGVDDSIINQCCNHTKESAGGFLWNRCGDYNPYILKNIRVKPVVQLSIDNNYINQYSSPKDASMATGVNRADIISVCRNRLKTAGGYVWRYLYDYLHIFDECEVENA